ncbi:MAG: fused MFS/spermidine synthase [Myxococcales bacterium]
MSATAESTVPAAANEPLSPLRATWLAAHLVVHRRLFFFFAGAAALACIPVAVGVAPPRFMAFVTGLVGCWLGLLGAWRLRRDLILSTAAGLIALGPIGWWSEAPVPDRLLMAAGVSGAVSLALLASHWLRGEPSVRPLARSLFYPLAAIPCFNLAALFLTEFSAVFLPNTLDAMTAAADAAFGFVPGAAVMGLLQSQGWLTAAAHGVYETTFFALLAVYVLDLARPKAPVLDFLSVVLVATFGACVAFYLFPVVGPLFVAPRATPEALEGLARLPLAPWAAGMAPRNCVPSMHFGWAVLIAWHSREHGKWLRGLAVVYLALNVLATLGFGYHYLVDLVASLPAMLMARAALVPAGRADRERRDALVVSSALLVGWLLFLRFGPVVGLPPAWAMWLLAGAVALVPVFLEARLWAACTRAVTAPTPTPAAAPAVLEAGAGLDASVRWATSLFFVSGFAALIYEVSFGKVLAATFGTTSRANVTVVATYMGGLAIGSWLGGAFGARTRSPLRLYALLEGGVALLCAVLPFAAKLIPPVYLALASGRSPSEPILIVYQVALSALLMLPPTVLMGMTLPVLYRRVTAGQQATGRAVAVLYGVNTLGAALGALLAGYVILPKLGLTDGMRLAVACNLFVALVGLRLAARDAAGTEAAPPAVPAGGAGARPVPAKALGLTALFLVGFLCTTLEADYMHLLAVVAGNSTYAFSLMLFSFLVGLGLGGALSGRLLQPLGRAPALVGALSFALCFAILGGGSVWDGVPGFFASFQRYALPHALREFIRFLVCLGIMLPPTIVIGAMYPLSMECATGPSGDTRALGRAAALNTVGNILGGFVGGLLLLDWLGGLGLQVLLAAVAFLVGAVAIAFAHPGSRLKLGALGLVCLVGWGLLPRELDYTRLSSGANVYFAVQEWGVAIDKAESADGGLTTVALKTLDGAPMHTLLTNGKFQGNDAGEVEAQYSFGLFPLLHTAQRGNALVVGYGTGTSAHVVRSAGFARLDVAELSRDIVSLADRYFSHVNGRVLEDPSVRLHVTDGRNLLLLSKERYDLVSMEISSIWFAGAAMLYGQDFYRLVREHLAPGGVFQQWVQLHHITSEAMLTVLVTFRREFPHSYLYFRGGQGVLVGCAEACPPTPEVEAKLTGEPRLKAMIPAEGLKSLHQQVLLDPARFDRLLASLEERGYSLDEYTSTDDNLLLEYATPKGNALGGEQSVRRNLSLLSKLTKPVRAQAPSPPAQRAPIEEDEPPRPSAP